MNFINMLKKNVKNEVTERGKDYGFLSFHETLVLNNQIYIMKLSGRRKVMCYKVNFTVVKWYSLFYKRWRYFNRRIGCLCFSL